MVNERLPKPAAPEIIAGSPLPACTIRLPKIAAGSLISLSFPVWHAACSLNGAG
jgi:hypothetical protein